MSTNSKNRWSCAWTFISKGFLLLWCSAAVAQENISVTCGDDAVLRCNAPSATSVDGLEWTKTGLDKYIILYKDGNPDPTDQDEAYSGRCEIKSGTADLVIHNVTIADSGTYECRFVNNSDRVKRSIIQRDPVSVVHLKVTGAETEAKEGNDVPATRPHYGIWASLGMMILFIIFIF